MHFARGFFIRITAKLTSYRVVFDLFSPFCKKPRLNQCRKINLVRHDGFHTRKGKWGYPRKAGHSVT
jgi:hypothetical protein